MQVTEEDVMNIDTSKSNLDILHQLITAYKHLDTISDDMRFQQLATIDSILADCMEGTISNDELAYRVNEAVGEYNTLVANRR